MEATRPLPQEHSTIRHSHRRSATVFGGFFSLAALSNVARDAWSGAAVPWWQWLAVPAVTFLLFGGLAYSLLRTSGRAAPVNGSIPVSMPFAAAVIGVFLIVIGVPILALGPMHPESGRQTIAWIGAALVVWLLLVAVTSYFYDRAGKRSGA